MGTVRTLSLEGICILPAVVSVGLAVWKWHIIRDRRLILSTIGAAVKERKAFWIGTLAGVIYMAVFMILGGKGGRIHVLFGRLVLNATAGEILAGLLLGFLVMISMTLFVYGIQVMGPARPGKEGGIRLFAAFLAVLAAFCP
jgi:hypothetical protein